MLLLHPKARRDITNQISIFAPQHFKSRLRNIFTPFLGFDFAGPKGIAVNRSGHLVVVDNRASCIFVFQPNGKLVQKFGSRGSEPGKLAGPHFVAIDSQDHIIVSDFHNHSIKVSQVIYKMGLYLTHAHVF